MSRVSVLESATVNQLPHCTCPHCWRRFHSETDEVEPVNQRSFLCPNCQKIIFIRSQKTGVEIVLTTSDQLFLDTRSHV